MALHSRQRTIANYNTVNVNRVMIKSVLNEWHDWTMHSLIKYTLDSNLPTGCTLITGTSSEGDGHVVSTHTEQTGCE